jgi:DNA repair protein RadC
MDETKTRYQTVLSAVCQARDETIARITEAYPGGRGLCATTEMELRGLGCSEAQARRLLAAVGLQQYLRGGEYRPTLRQPADVVTFVRKHTDIANSEQERFLVVALDARQRILSTWEVARGSLAQVDVHPREVFTPLVRARAHSAILVHNHPSEEADPSDADLDLTQRLCDVGKLLGIPVLDHIIVTATDHVSVAGRGLMPR